MTITEQIKTTVEFELRKGTSKSRIAHILGVSYEEAHDIIDEIKALIRPDINASIRFKFRDKQMIGTIVKLLNNSAVVLIDWDRSSEILKDLCEDKTIVNFKDIIEFLH